MKLNHNYNAGKVGRSGRRGNGFTMIELMISLVIVGILSAVAVPMYDDYIKKSRRSDAVAALLNVQLAQERHRATHTEYAASITAAKAAVGGGLGMSASSNQGFYNLAIVSSNASSFVISAGPVIGGLQDGDMCTSTHFRVSEAGPVLGTTTQKECWSR